MPKAGKYRIARKIADGGMAEIFLGTQHGMEGFERPVVLKRILAPLVADPQFRNMLIDEAHVAMGLNHSNIVQVLDLGHVRGRYFLVMELVDGWDLSQIMARATVVNFPVPPEIVLYIAAEICRALAYAHARTRDGQPLAIVHRDVSPQNVLISEQGEVKLTDFGIAKAMGRREHTNQGVIKGKLAFMSPEQASGAVLDGRSDLFALGTILYLFFVGRRPFEAPTDLESIMRVRECRFTPPEAVKPGLHPELVKIIRRVMQALPADRYQSADEMLIDIENVQRTVYKPSGQTELKRWLADLQQRDRCPTISHIESAIPVPAVNEELDVGEGAEVVFDESSVMEIDDLVRGIQETVAATPGQLPIVRPRTEERTSAATPVAIRQNHIPARIIVFALILAALAFGAWLALPDSNRRSAKSHPDERVKHTDLASKTGTKAEAELPPIFAVDAGAGLAIDSGTAGAPSTSSKNTGTSTADNKEEDDEETLLKNAEPENGDRVIDEDEGVPSRRKHVAAKTSVPATVPVSVRVVSSPEGAVVSLGKRVFGRAPLNLRFRPGITFELKFVKKGYLPATERFTVKDRKNQSVKVALKKRTEAKRSLFHRIFGGR
jgi:serine/threonine-protein kinase